MSRKISLTLFGIALAVLLLEALLRVLPTSTYSDTGYYIDPLIISYRPHHQFRSSWGWDFSEAVSHRANNLGFLSARDFVPDGAALALIGDSFVDASMLPEAERVAAHLEQELDGRPVYAMGGPGSSLLDYGERLRYASEHLGIRDFVVVLERFDLRQAYCGSGNIHGPCIERATGEVITSLRPPPPKAQRYLRHSALLQYLLGHLRFDPLQRLRTAWAALSFGAAPPRSPPREFSTDELERALLTFFERIAPYRQGRLVMVFDCDRGALTRGETGSDAGRDMAMRVAREHGALVVDLAPSFRDYLARSGRHLEVSPVDKHWNRAATRVVAHDIAATLSHGAP